MKEDTKRLTENQVCTIIHMRDIRKSVYLNLQGFVGRRHVLRVTIMAAGNQSKHLFLSFPTYA